MESGQVKIPSPPGLIASFAAGFDAIANNILVIALPVLLDLFLWLGPHLWLKQLIQPWIDSLTALSAQFSTASLDPAVLNQITDYVNRFNLFSILRTFPVGTSSLMSGQLTTQTPFGGPPGFEANSIAGFFGWGLLIVLIGWIIGSVYFQWISSVALKLPHRSILPSVLQAILLSAIWVVLLFVVGLPVLVFFSILQMISQLLAQGALLLLGLFSLWLVLPIFFSPHGIFTYQQNALHAILNSLRMIRYTLPTSGLFLLGVILIGQGLDFLWRTPPDGSWWMLVGITGHAFVSTALLAASFVYYRDINAWLKVVFEQLKTQTLSIKAQ